MKKKIFVLLLIFISFFEAKAVNSEWVSFYLMIPDFNVKFDFIKQYDKNKIWFTNNCNSYKSVNNVIKWYGYEFSSTYDLEIDRTLFVWKVESKLGSGIEKRNSNDSVIKAYGHSDTTFPSGSYWSVAVDSLNNKWFGLDSGLMKYNDTSWSLIKTKDKIAHICANKKNEIWAVFDINFKYSYIGRFDGKNWSYFDSTQTGISRSGFNIHINSDSQNRIWIRSDSFISFFDGTWHQIINIAKNLLDADGICIKNDVVWLGGKGILLKLENGLSSGINMPSFAGERIYTIGIDADNNK
ncbi:MAG: hypothetical protein NT007_02735 [Candidatus Kapabacteria bacterium]|nr:hypothetical protein [Candidatus Kapabacteria bacterium]